MEIRNDSHHPHCKIPPGVRSFVAIGEKKIQKNNDTYINSMSSQAARIMTRSPLDFSNRLQKV